MLGYCTSVVLFTHRQQNMQLCGLLAPSDEPRAKFCKMDAGKGDLVKKTGSDQGNEGVVMLEMKFELNTNEGTEGTTDGATV